MTYSICTFYRNIDSDISDFNVACQQAKDKSIEMKDKFLMVVNEENEAKIAFKNGEEISIPN